MRAFCSALFARRHATGRPGRGARLSARAVSALLLVAVALPVAAAHPETARAAAGGPPGSLGRIAVVPLDDRPFTSYTPVAVAEAGAHEALTPPKDLLGEFFTHGDSESVAAWWRTAARAADGSVVAVPMLAYGGLVASRTCRTSLDDARRRLAVLDEVKRANPTQPVYAFDVIMRLTIEPTSGYPGRYSGLVRRWAILMDQVENLGREDLRAEYEQVAAEIPDEIKADYLCARARNHEINRDMIRRVAAGTVDYLILGQDDASEFGPHRPEKAALAALVAELGLQDRVKIYPGADVLGALLVAKHVTARLGSAPTVTVEWSRTPGEEWTAPYQDVPYATLVNEYVRTVGGTVVDDPEADILLMANTGGGGSLQPFADRIHDAVAHGRLVAIGDDAVAGRVDPELRDLLVPRIRLADLAAWSGWNIGLSIAQSAVRASLLDASRTRPLLRGSRSTKGEPVLAARRALLTRAATTHIELLLQELAHTDVYRHQVLDQVKVYAEQNGDDPQHMTKVFESANQLAVQAVTPLADQLYATEFAGAPVRLGSDGQGEVTAVVRRLDGWATTLAWPRYQEIEIFPTLELGTDPADRQTLLTVSSLPHTAAVRPQADVDLRLTAVVRNDTAAPVTAHVTATTPAGWIAPAPVEVTLAPFEVREIPLVVGVRGAQPEEVQTVEVVARHGWAAHDLRLTARAASTVTAVWRNVALASTGASAVASSWWMQYQPGFAIDGNRSSLGSRWLTEAGDLHWLEVRFAREEPIDTVELYQYGGYELWDYRILGLVSGQWQVLHEVAGNREQITTHTFAPVHATAVRLEVSASRDARVRLYEIEATCRTGSWCDG